MASKNTSDTPLTGRRESNFDADRFLAEYDERREQLNDLLDAARIQADTTPSCQRTKARKVSKKSRSKDIDISAIDFNIIRADDTTDNPRSPSLFKTVGTTSVSDVESTDTAHNDRAAVTTPSAATIPTDEGANVIKTAETAETASMAKTDISIAMTIMDVTDRESEAKTEAVTEEQSARSPKLTRISGRMRRAGRDEFCGTYTRKTDTKGGSPITIAPDILKTAHVICAKSGNYRTCPTYVINNILRAVFEDMADEIKSWPMPE